MVLADHAAEVAALTLTAALPTAAYIGFALPRRRSRIAIAGLLALVSGLLFLVPDLNLLDTAVTVGLVLIGWVSGLIPRHGHRFGLRQAALLSRTDALTKGLSRRGFLEQLAFDLQGASPDAIAALLVLDIDNFKRVNDDSGHAAGDELLSWIGDVIPPLLPTDAAFGRLGGDEFAVLLLGTDIQEAVALGSTLRAAVAERISSSVGVATTDDGESSWEALLDAATHAVILARHDPAFPVQHRSADHRPAEAGSRAEPPAVTFAAVRSGERPAAMKGEGLALDGRWLAAGFLTLALAGSFVVAATFMADGDTIYQQLVRYLGIPWVLVNVVIAVVYRHRINELGHPALVPFYASAILLGLGVGGAALASGHGAAAPIAGALFIKVLFDATMFDRRLARRLFAIMALAWVLILALGPPGALWIAPFQAVLLVGAARLGALGRDGTVAVTSVRLKLAQTDELTGLLNRRGFEVRAHAAVERAAAEGTPLALITLDLDGFRELNEAEGLAVGDRTLESIAGMLMTVLPDPYAVGRIGGDEFALAVPAASADQLARDVRTVREALEPLSPGSVGAALYGVDGDSFETLMQVADRRAYRTKEAARLERLKTLRGKPRRPGWA